MLGIAGDLVLTAVSVANLDDKNVNSEQVTDGENANTNLEDLFQRSRIAGAINVLTGATLGYSGFAALSRIEEQYLMLP